MAGSSSLNVGSGFNPDQFRAAIKGAMEMGLPESLSERVTFRWKTKSDYSVEDNVGNPYDFASEPIKEVSHSDVQVAAAVEFSNSRTEGGVSFGEFDNPRAIVTVLDDEYEVVKTANQVLLGGNTYWIRYWGPPMGLFSVTIYQAFLTAEDES